MRLEVVRPDCTPETPSRPAGGLGALVGGSPVMRELFARIERIAASDATVLIEGESGTGKELVARALHDRSRRRRGPFVTVDCGSLAPGLLESELFGHSKGAFTGAQAPRAGVLEAADGGTVFIDEIGELPLEMQPRLLRALEARTVRRVGENDSRTLDVRYVFATHRDLQQLVAQRIFRADLFFRLAVLRLRLPPLRERRDDIPALVERFLPGRADQLLTPAVREDLMSRHWPGNVRELRNAVERLAVLGPDLDPSPAGTQLTASGSAQPDPALELPARWSDLPYQSFRACALDALERAYLSRLLDRHQGQVSLAAQTAGIHRTHLYRLIRRHGL
jgi:DNA-binding NtrC family response regulator